MNQEVIVLGLGVMGAATCFQLAKLGHRVTGVEQFAIGHSFGSSHGQSRVIRKAYFEHVDYVPLLERSYELWRTLENESGQRLYHPTGLAYFCPEQSALLKGLRESARIHSLTIDTLSHRELTEFSSRFEIPKNYVSLIERHAGYLEAETCVHALAKNAEAHGAQFVIGEVVKSWRANSKEVEVITSQRTLKGERLIITAGAWSANLLHELRIPLRILKKTMYWFPASDEYREENGTPCFFFELPAGSFYGFPKSNISPYGLKVAEHTGGQEVTHPGQIDRRVEEEELKKTIGFLSQNLPGVERTLSSFETCMYTMTSDENFILDLHPDHANVSFAAGFSGHGFKFAPVIGEIMADFAIKSGTSHKIDFLRLR